MSLEWTSVGHTKMLRVLLVAWTIRRGKIRPITARPVSRKRAVSIFATRAFRYEKADRSEIRQ